MEVRPPHLLDTSILLPYIRGNELGAWLGERYGLDRSPVAVISIVTHGELLSLALRRNWAEPRRYRLDTVLSQLIAVPLEFEGVVAAYAEIECYSRGPARVMGENDLWIAATARATGAVLLTSDRDFDHLHPEWLRRDLIEPRAYRGAS